MSPKPLGCSLTCAVLLISCLGAQITSVTSRWNVGNQQGTENGHGAHEWLNRKDVIKKFPLDIQKAMLNKVLNQENVQLTGDLPPQLDDKIPEMVEYLVNGAIDVFFSRVPGLSQILGPVISVGINYLKRLFGGRRVYIPDMPPVIKCPANQIHYADKGWFSKVVTWKKPVGVDAEDGTLSNVRRTGKASGSRFSGEEYIKYEVSDSKGKTDFCMFAIIIKVIRCRPTPLEQHRITTCRGVTLYGDECAFTCAKGYTLFGQQKLTCTREGQYDWQAPTCRKSTCKKPKLPHGGANWTCSSNYNYNSVCTITCAQGFRNERTSDRAPWEQASIQCKENGEWTRLPICKDVVAPVINNCPLNVTAYGARGSRFARVTWDEIRATDANEVVTVTQIKGQKNGSEFTEGTHEVSYVAVDDVGLQNTCTFFVIVRILHCPVPVMAKPKVKVDCGNQFSYGSTCTLYCPLGLALQGSQSITCEKRGETDMYWAYTGSEPSCAVCKLDTQSVDVTNKRVQSFRIDNLKPDTDYVIIVYAMNEHGRGEVTTHNIRTKPAVTTTEQPTTPDPNACPPGTASFNGQKTPIPCRPCSLGFFQPNSGQQQCYVCAAGLTTWFPGATSSDDCVDETWTMPRTTRTTSTTPKPFSKVTPCPLGFVSPTGFTPKCRKCPDNQEPNVDKTSCHWCIRDAEIGYICSRTKT